MDEHEHDHEDDSKSYKSSWSWAREMNISRPATPSAKSTGAESTISRSSTPRWWRPSYPPKTYYWEEIRRKRRQGGYPWNYLDKDMTDLSDNLYEPVSPRPYYGSGDIGQDPETTSLGDRLIDIPPELDIVTSEGLDGLDKLDAHDYGFDGEKEWNHYPEEIGDSHVPKTFTAGIRRELPKFGETSSERPLMTKTGGTEEGCEGVTASAEQPAPKTSALTQLKQKADQVKKQLSKISLPAAPKFNNWSGLRLSKKKQKTENNMSMEDDEEVFEPMQTSDVGTEHAVHAAPPPEQKIKPPKPPPPKNAEKLIKSLDAGTSEKKDAEAIDKNRPKMPTKDDTKKAAEQLQRDTTGQHDVIEVKTTAIKEKPQRDKSPTDLKRLQKQEEKLAKEKSQEEAKRLKAEEKAAKEKAKEEKRKAEAEDKLLKKKQDDELKRARLEEERKQTELDAEAKRVQMEKNQTQVEQVAAESTPKNVQPSTSATAQVQLQAEKTLQQQKLKEEEKKQKSSTPPQFKVTVVESEIVKTTDNENEAATSTAPKEKKSRTEVFKRKLADIDFTKKFKRSKTPPARPDEPPKLKYQKTGRKDDETDNKLAAQYAQEILRRDAEMEIEKEKESQQQQQHKLHEPVIYVTQPSVETTDTESRSTDVRPTPLYYENVPDSEAPPKPKFGEKVKGFGQKSKVIASQTSKNFGQKIKVIGHDLKQFGGKVNVKCQETIKEIKATQEAAKKRSQEAKEARAQAQAAEAAEKEGEEPEKPPKTSFRFKKRPLNDEESFKKQEIEPVVVPKTRRKKKPLSQEFHEYLEQHPEDIGSTQQKKENKINRNDVVGHADRDWESQDLIQSRDPSEEPFAGRYSPPGSSTASSRRQGVLEEIDSDEFFLRERGISEGEDEEEVNRMLMDELRQTFRPLDNSLRGFDMPSPPPRPARSPRKPPRRAGGKDSNFQTFPPERPKRKQTPGYISAYLNQGEHQDIKEDLGGDLRMSEEDDEFMALESDEDEGIRRVKLELRRIDQDMEDEKIRYEPVLTEESPLKPTRSKKGRTKSKENEPPPPVSEERPQIFYYNTIGANEWMKKVEAQIEGAGPSSAAVQASPEPPVPPKRVRRKSEGGKSARSEGGKSGKSETQFSEIDNMAVGLTRSTGQQDLDEMAHLSVQVQADPATLELSADDSMEYVDYEEDPGGGYAMVVQKKFGVEKNLPKTAPRRKQQQRDKHGRKSQSLKRRSREGDQNEAGESGNPVFCTLPRYTPRTFHIVPPTRPHRNYSSLKPKRPPRQSTKNDMPSPSQQQQGTSSGISHPPAPIITRRSPRLGARDEDDTADPIQRRPLPPPPRPQRSPGPLNDLDHSTIERMVGIRHYANFVTDEADGDRVPVVEEPCVATNISLLGGGRGDGNESNVGVQTDPVQGEEEIDLNEVGSFEDEDDGIDKQRDSAYRTLSSDGQQVRGERPPAARVTDRPSSPRLPAPAPSPAAPAPRSTEVIFPNRLHLDELEVDFLRVNELTAQSITMDHLHTPQLYVDSMSSSGALIVPLIQSSNLAVDQVNTERVCTTDLSSSGTSIPPPSFYQLAATPQTRTAPEGEAVQEIDASLRFQTQRSPGQVGRTPAQPPTQVARRNSADDVLRQTMRLGRAILSSAMRGLDNITDYLDAATSNDPDCHAQQRSQIQILLCMLLVLVIGIYLLSGSSSPTPKWEFFLPPPNL